MGQKQEIKKLLVVDDDESISALFGLFAKKYGISYVSAHNGVEGYKKIINQKFDFIITDLKMPKMNGVKFIQKIRSLPDYKKLPIYAISAGVQEFAPEIALMDHVITLEKPISLKIIDELFKYKFGSSSINKNAKKYIGQNKLEAILKSELIQSMNQVYNIIFKENLDVKWENEKYKEDLFVSKNFYLSYFEINEFKYLGFFRFDEKLSNELTKTFSGKTVYENGQKMVDYKILQKVGNIIFSKIKRGLEDKGVKVNLCPIGLYYNHAGTSCWTNELAKDFDRLNFSGAKGGMDFLLLQLIS